MAEQKPPPETKAGKTPVAKSKSETMDIDVQAEGVRDGRTGRKDIHGKTSFDPVGVGGKKFAYPPGYDSKSQDGEQVVTKVKGPAVIKGVIKIQTVYGPDAKATDRSEYGGGTTSQDEKAGNKSLGFHESCHRADFLAYLGRESLPEFYGTVGMTVTEFKKAQTEFGAAIEQYLKDMDDDSFKRTDEVGYRYSTYESKGPREDS